MCMYQVWMYYLPDSAFKGANQTVRMRKLVSAFVVHKQHNYISCDTDVLFVYALPLCF